MTSSRHSFLASSLALLSLSNLASAGISNVSSSACPSPGGAHIIVARASTEAPGYGVIGVVKDAVLAQVPGSTAEAVDYPATLTDYFNSETAGVIAMRKLINAWAAKCVGSPLVVMGYSQGAQVTADSMVGQLDHGFTDDPDADTTLDPSVLARTAAVIMMGDPSFITNETFHVGTATKNGLFPRIDEDAFERSGLASRTQSYCDDGDPYCDAGHNIVVHLSYVGEYGMAATDFVVKNIKAFYGNSTGGGNSTTTPAASGTAVSSRRPASTGTGTGARPSGSGVASPTGARNSSSTATGTVSIASTPTALATSTATANSAVSARDLTTVGTLSGVLAGGLLAWML